MGRVQWSADEDRKLCDYIERNGGEPSSWKNVPWDAGLSWRTSKKRYQQNPLSEEEKLKIIEFQRQYINRNPVGIGFGPTSIPDASSIPAPVSASLEPSKGDQVVEIVEDTPADQYSEYFLQELLRDQEPSDSFMENIFTASPDADRSQNIIN
ncbi:hypothetical protein AAG906_005367 [Vitis piasezkii]